MRLYWAAWTRYGSTWAVLTGPGKRDSYVGIHLNDAREQVKYKNREKLIIFKDKNPFL